MRAVEVNRSCECPERLKVEPMACVANVRGTAGAFQCPASGSPLLSILFIVIYKNGSSGIPLRKGMACSICPWKVVTPITLPPLYCKCFLYTGEERTDRALVFMGEGEGRVREEQHDSAESLSL